MASLNATETARERWLRPSQVCDLFEQAGLFRVPMSTLRDWAEAGRITSWRTAGGHRRFRESDARALIAELRVAA